jgi:hypothetical protein
MWSSLIPSIENTAMHGPEEIRKAELYRQALKVEEESVRFDDHAQLFLPSFASLMISAKPAPTL